jgi:hypothetical protein
MGIGDGSPDDRTKERTLEGLGEIVERTGFDALPDA